MRANSVPEKHEKSASSTFPYSGEKLQVAESQCVLSSYICGASRYPKNMVFGNERSIGYSENLREGYPLAALFLPRLSQCNVGEP